MLARVLKVGLATLTVISFFYIAQSAAEPERHHALWLVKPPKYGPDATHFSFVNPNAPKAGRARLWSVGAFDSLNQFSFKGQSAAGLNLIYDRLMAPNGDEPGTIYGLIAEWASYPDDYSSVTFKLRDEARWHDGKPITVEDVVFSLEAQKRASPTSAQYYKNVVRAEKTGDRQVTFYFDTKGNRELPVITAELQIIPKHWWTGKNADGEPRDITKTFIELPLGSGPYRVKEIRTGRAVTYERMPDYWAKDLLINRGRNNLDSIRYEYFRDTTVAFEAFKADQIDFHTENSSKNWATAYTFPALNRGFVKKREVALETGAPMQGFAFNLRRKKFSDPRVRRAFNYAFNFEWSNKNLFYGQYARTSSYFQNMELAAKGLPEGRELEILNEVRDQVPPEVFTEPYKNPVNQDPRAFRGNLRKAKALLEEAGWTLKNGALTHEKTGEKMQVEFLLVSPAFERVVQPYVRNLQRLGVTATIRVIDVAQYIRRLENTDFDIIVESIAQSQSPGNEQRSYWGSQSADQRGSRNRMGIKNPAIDKLIDKVIFAEDRAELVAASRALDRVLLWNFYMVPQWYSPYQRIAYWDRYAHASKLPSQTVGFPSFWWYDAQRAANLAEAK